MARIQKKFNNLYAGMGKSEPSWFMGFTKDLLTDELQFTQEADIMNRPGAGSIAAGLPADSIHHGDYIWHVKGNLLVKYDKSNGTGAASKIDGSSNLSMISIVKTANAQHIMILTDVPADGVCVVSGHSLEELEGSDLGDVKEFNTIEVTIPNNAGYFPQSDYPILGPNSMVDHSGNLSSYDGMELEHTLVDNFIVTDVKSLGEDHFAWQITSSNRSDFALNECVIFETKGNPLDPWGIAPEDNGGVGTLPVFTPIEWFGSSRPVVNYGRNNEGDAYSWEYCTNQDTLNAATDKTSLSSGGIPQPLTGRTFDGYAASSGNALDGRGLIRHLKIHACKIPVNTFPMPFQMYHDSSYSTMAFTGTTLGQYWGDVGQSGASLSSTTYIDDLDGRRVHSFNVSNIKGGYSVTGDTYNSSPSYNASKYNDWHEEAFRVNLYGTSFTHTPDINMTDSKTSAYNNFTELAGTLEQSLSLKSNLYSGADQAIDALKRSGQVGIYRNTLEATENTLEEDISEPSGAIHPNNIGNQLGYYPGDTNNDWPSEMNYDWQEGVHKDNFFERLDRKLWFHGEARVSYPKKALSVDQSSSVDDEDDGTRPKRLFVSCRPKDADTGSSNSWIKYKGEMLLECGIVAESSNAYGHTLGDTTEDYNPNQLDSSTVNATMHCNWEEYSSDNMLLFQIGSKSNGHIVNTAIIESDNIDEDMSIFDHLSNSDGEGYRRLPERIYDGVLNYGSNEYQQTTSPIYAILEENEDKFTAKHALSKGMLLEHLSWDDNEIDRDAFAYGIISDYSTYMSDLLPLSGRDVRNLYGEEFEVPIPNTEPWGHNNLGVSIPIRDHAFWAYYGTSDHPFYTMGFVPTNASAIVVDEFTVNGITVPSVTQLYELNFTDDNGNNEGQNLFADENAYIIDQAAESANLSFWSTSHDLYPLNPVNQLTGVLEVSATRVSDVNTTQAVYNTAFVKMSITKHVGTENNFLQDFSVDYKYTLVYDNNQETPLSLQTESGDDDTDDVSHFEINFEYFHETMSNRITHINLYRKYNKSDGTGDAEYKLIFSKKLRPFGQHVINSDGNPVFTFYDYNKEGPSYSSINGVSESYFNLSLNYNLSASIDNYLFVTQARVPGLSDDFETYIFRSLPKRFSQFNWAVDYQSLQEAPIAMVAFNARIFVFTKSRILRINPYTLDIEDDYEGVSCMNKDSVAVTEFGMCFADRDNIYLHDGVKPTIISAVITSTNYFHHLTNSKPGGWRDRIKTNVHVAYSPKQTSFLIFFSTMDGNWCWAYNVSTRRWDLLTSPGKVKGTFLSPSNEVLLVLETTDAANNGYTNFSSFCSSPTGDRKNWTWYSKAITAGRDIVDKRFNNLKVLYSKGNSANSSSSETSPIKDNIKLGWEGVGTLVAPTSSKDTVLSDETRLIKCLSNIKNFRSLNVALSDMPGDVAVDSLGVIFRPRKVK